MQVTITLPENLAAELTSRASRQRQAPEVLASHLLGDALRQLGHAESWRDRNRRRLRLIVCFRQACKTFFRRPDRGRVFGRPRWRGGLGCGGLRRAAMGLTNATPRSAVGESHVAPRVLSADGCPCRPRWQSTSGRRNGRVRTATSDGDADRSRSGAEGPQVLGGPAEPEKLADQERPSSRWGPDSREKAGGLETAGSRGRRWRQRVTHKRAEDGRADARTAATGGTGEPATR
jgi:hypothetical protein